MKQMIRFTPVMLVLFICGCDDDARLADLAQESARRQAEQNQAMAEVNREVAEGSKRLIQAGAEATDKVLTMEKQLQQQRRDLELERQQLAEKRNSDSLLGTALVSTATLFAISLPLVLCWFLLHSLQPLGETAVSDLLIEELDRSADDDPAPPDSPHASQNDLEA